MVFRWGQTFLTQLEQLSFQGQCALCQRKPAASFCQDCYQQLRECQYSKGYGHLQTDPPLWAWGRYTGALKQALSQLKYGHNTRIAQPLGEWLGLTWSITQRHRPWVVPIPLHHDRKQERGYNQAALIAQGFCHTTGLTCVKQGLIRMRATEAQFSLTPAERWSNVEGAFKLGAGFPQVLSQRPVLLIDDIYTTGATVRMATQTLQAAGISVIGAATVAQATVSFS